MHSFFLDTCTCVHSLAIYLHIYFLAIYLDLWFKNNNNNYLSIYLYR